MIPTFFAEIKTKSPFGFTTRHSWMTLFKMANEIGDVLSIHTNPLWNGSMELVKKAKDLTDKPILAKGVHSTDREIEEALKSGATFVLVVGRRPDASLEAHCFIEPLSLEELMDIPSDVKVVWNSRDLLTGGQKTIPFSVARQRFGGWMVQASNITKMSDVDKTADGFIVGQGLPRIYPFLRKRLNIS